MSNTRFEGIPIIGWAIDSIETIRDAMQQSGEDLTKVVKRYTDNSYNKYIAPLFTNAPFKLNLGGETNKNKLISVDKPIGVFNFSLAAQTLYPLTEFYSLELAQDDPERFSSLNLLPGLVPNDLVTKRVVANNTFFIYKDDKKEYLLEKKIKGTTAIDMGIPGAKKKYASKTKKVYQTYNRKGGKVKYVEIYSLFYYTSLSGDLQFAVRHLPAIMVSEYLESIGIKTRFYMTRFVKIGSSCQLRKETPDGISLPMAKIPLSVANNRKFSDFLLIQPILAKEYGAEVDKPFAFAISSNSYSEIYEACVDYTYKKELVRDKSKYGDPDWRQDEYWEGIERYRNKYQEYTKLGVFQAKEVQPEGMIFFHDYAIKKHFYSFMNSMIRVSDYQSRFKSQYSEEQQSEVLEFYEVNRFFVWWMKTSGNTIKHKVNLLNSSSYEKDMKEVVKDLEDTIAELKSICTDKNTPDEAIEIFKQYGTLALDNYGITDNTDYKQLSDTPTSRRYMEKIINEIMTFADNEFYPTPEESVENRLNFKLTVYESLQKIL
jgi:hypothetical protein